MWHGQTINDGLAAVHGGSGHVSSLNAATWRSSRLSKDKTFGGRRYGRTVPTRYVHVARQRPDRQAQD